ncbi:RXT2-like protein [Lasiosphaeria miniovina]|uniref:RXT2-like protein n=1 Tax=Lasiosphaeria miniovina TaxID=1954250 RepID=A0AA40A5G9_9PEZI|nr:RXT2-like protein [Lasiosphaeria miniovina]KAK0709691.1 RXT2-like protein [Lasiosphaeria miniovina]
MSTQQQAMVMETIVAIRKALKRKAYDSDSDSSIDHTTNRGYKLKKRARFVRQGRLAASTGAAAYKDVAEHAGYQRTIINHNPPLVDDEGYELDSDDNEEHIQEAIASAMEENPYSSIHLEQLLAPLTAVTDLPNHPTLSRPYISKALPDLVKQASSLMQKENAALWKAKPLLTKLIGDNTWAPCGVMIQPNDQELFTNTASFLRRRASPIGADAIPNANKDSSSGSLRQDSRPKNHIDGTNELSHTENDALDDKVTDGEAVRNKHKDDTDGERPPGKADINTSEAREQGDASSSKEKLEDKTQVNGHARPREGGKGGKMPAVDGQDDTEMAEAASETGSLDDFLIHPLFLAPRSAQPDRDLGLPEQEAEDVRRLLQLYVQKQEEVCRGTRALYKGLLKADRYRKTVWQWAKSEAHSGANRDMSDGEDWYDKEEWGLTEDLKKGADEVEEDTSQTQKKTRNRK